MHNYIESFALADLTVWMNNDKYLRKLKEKKKKQKDRESIHGL